MPVLLLLPIYLPECVMRYGALFYKQSLTKNAPALASCLLARCEHDAQCREQRRNTAGSGVHGYTPWQQLRLITSENEVQKRPRAPGLSATASESDRICFARAESSAHAMRAASSMRTRSCVVAAPPRATPKSCFSTNVASSRCLALFVCARAAQHRRSVCDARSTALHLLACQQRACAQDEHFKLAYERLSYVHTTSLMLPLPILQMRNSLRDLIVEPRIMHACTQLVASPTSFGRM